MSNVLGMALLAAIALALAVVAFLFWRRYAAIRSRFASVLDTEAERDKAARERDKLRDEVTRQRDRWKVEFERTVAELQELTAHLDKVRDTVEIQSYGLYEPEFAFGTSDEYKAAVEEVRGQQKSMVKAGTAAVCPTEWRVQGSAAKGRQMVKRQLKLQLRAFNGEADAAISRVRYNNVTAMEDRIRRAFDAINKLGDTQNCSITPGYLKLRIQELHLAHELEEKKQAEREEQREIREQMQEEARAEKELEQARKTAEKEEARYAEALAKAREEVAAAEGAKQEKLVGKIAELERRLEEAKQNRERAVSRAQMTRSGFVYVISNVGSFGEDIYKIGMTRRLDPMDRVRELGGASVPFPFDVHAMIFTKDAPELENLLQHRFANHRLNLVNLRREFFKVSLDEIADVVHEKDATFQLTMVAEAEQFRRSEARRFALAQAAQRSPHDAIVEDAKRRLAELQAEWATLDTAPDDEWSED